MTGDLVELHDELRRVARDLLGKTTAGEADWSRAADLGWLGLEVPDALGGAGASFAETAVVLEEMGRAATASSYLGTAVLGVAAIGAAAPQPVSDELLRAIASGDRRIAVALAASGDDATFDPPFRVEHAASGPRLSGRAEFVADAAEADDLIVLAVGADQAPVLVHIPAAAVTVTRQPV
ncbi:MAG: acyl-CoA dehydrogenase domain protein, partial [Acidimicrobiales bacterium]|nr:acyl-CoA dehydrogenase domain protein [Acidimicrobiales bacterium]